MKLLLDHGADAAVSVNFLSAIALAAEGGNEPTVKALLGHCQTDRKSEALIAAARRGHGSIVQALLDAGADERCEVEELMGWSLVLRIPDDGDYDYAGMFRLLEFDPELHRMLKNCGEDMTTPDVALGYAIRRGYRGVVEVLLEYSTVKRSLALATKLGGERIEQLLLEHTGENKEGR